MTNTNSWPPSEPFDDREPWPKVLPSRAAAGFPDVVVARLGHPEVMAAVWCRTALDDAHRYYQAARQCVWANWAIDRMEEWSPDEAQFAGWVQGMWVAGCRLVISAHLAQQWVRLADREVPEIPGLRVCRNAIEHLHEADFDDEQVIATTRISDDGKKAWDIEKLPEERLILGMGSDPLATVFGAVSMETIVDFAHKHSKRDVEVELGDSAYLIAERPNQ